MIDEKELLAVLCELGKNTQRQIKAAERNPEEAMLEFALKNQLAMLHGVIGKVKELPKIGEWIPCSVRLPNVSRCMTTIKYEMEVGPPEYETNIADFGRWQDGYGFRDDNMNDITCCVTAWQPLPEPYKGEKGECLELPGIQHIMNRFLKIN